MLFDFLQMDGYGFYVWSAWTFVGLAIAGLLAYMLMANRHVRRELEQLQTKSATMKRINDTVASD